MKTYLKLEFKKFHLKQHIKGLLLVIAGMLLFETIGFLQSAGSGADTYDPYLPRVMSLLVATTFIIYSSVFIGNLIIREYTNRTILILFSYPVNRKKILLLKLCMVIGFTMLCILAGNLLCQLYVIAAGVLFDAVTGTPDWEYFAACIAQTLYGCFMGGLLSTLVFVAGMRKKSMPATFISSVAIAAFYFETTGLIRDFKILLPISAVLAVVLFFLVKYTIDHKIEDLDM